MSRAAAPTERYTVNSVQSRRSSLASPASEVPTDLARGMRLRTRMAVEAETSTAASMDLYFEAQSSFVLTA